MHNATDDLMGGTTTGFAADKFRIEMRGDGGSGWVKLGGIFDGPTADQRLVDYQEFFMCAPTNTTRSCKREFRLVACDKGGNPV